MSNPDVRQAIMTEVAAQVAPLPCFNLSDYASVQDLPANTTEECVLVDFIASNDRMITIGGDGNQGWEESGSVAIHWLCPTGFLSLPILQKAEAVRLKLRGRRLARNLVIEAVDPFADAGSPVDIDSGWTAYSAYLFYTRNSCG